MIFKISWIRKLSSIKRTECLATPNYLRGKKSKKSHQVMCLPQSARVLIQQRRIQKRQTKTFPDKSTKNRFCFDPSRAINKVWRVTWIVMLSFCDNFPHFSCHCWSFYIVLYKLAAREFFMAFISEWFRVKALTMDIEDDFNLHRKKLLNFQHRLISVRWHFLLNLFLK